MAHCVMVLLLKLPSPITSTPFVSVLPMVLPALSLACSSTPGWLPAGSAVPSVRLQVPLALFRLRPLAVV